LGKGNPQRKRTAATKGRHPVVAPYLLDTSVIIDALNDKRGRCDLLLNVV